MSTCGTEMLCGFLSQYITITSPLQYMLIKIVLVITVVYGAFQFGKVYAGRAGEKSEREAFIKGIMYHINVLAYNDAKIPQKHDSENDRRLIEAQNRLAKKIKP